MNIKWSKLILCIAIPIFIGALSSHLTQDSAIVYELIEKPPLSPPPQIFGPVWTVLYVLMGVASYLVLETKHPRSKVKNAITFYAVSLLLNFLWPIVFFNLEMYLVALILILVLLIVVLMTTVTFYEIKPLAGLLMIPYILWLAFATYLNWGIYLLNR